MKNNAIVLTAAFLFFLTLTLSAQRPWSLELRGDAAFPTQELGDADLKTGFGLEATLAYEFVPSLAAYAGWGWHRFSADGAFAGIDADFEETGYTFGLRWQRPLGGAFDFFVSAGALYNHLELENEEGDITADSGHGFGWEAAAGLAIRLGERWQLRPGVRYRSLSRDLDIGNTTTEADLRYLTASLGVAWTF